ncbi:coproporphyrinogen-III oxidase family protein [Haliangium sp.]|uniref:coproporphyrinogen-III oxidase family protein n=1 Tax=Haliangium sp. TaxID=2663208 RepID=UPI003D09BA0B
MVAPLGVYVHVPWCRRLCPYCDFAVTVVGRRPIPHRAYLDAILAEWAEHAPGLAGRELVSIYFGGGTPSLWEPDCLAATVNAIAGHMGADPAGLEITLEANPDDCTPARLAAWRRAGINRLSIGVQSLSSATLARLGRDHLGDGPAALSAAREAGFERLSADLIFAVPEAASASAPGTAAASEASRGDHAGLDPSVAQVADMGVGHLSVYELTIEERTSFGKAARRGRLVPLSDERRGAQYEAAHELLCGRGYEHYEISSYARPGQRAVHNQLYWTGGEYLGLGCGAASFVLDRDGGAERRTNLRALAPYLRARGPERVAERERLDPGEVAVDRVWLGLRTVDGVPERSLAGAPALVAWLLGDRLAVRRDERICPTLRGFLYADRIASRVFAGGATLGHPGPAGAGGADPPSSSTPASLPDAPTI